MFDFELTQNSLYATIYDEYKVFTQVVQNEGVYFSKTWKPLELECLHNSNDFLLSLVVWVIETPLYKGPEKCGNQRSVRARKVCEPD